MALTFTDWTHYTDDGGTARTLDWTDPAGCVTRAHGEAIRQAAIERAAIKPVTPPAILTAPIVPNAPMLQAWFVAMYSLIGSGLYTTGDGRWVDKTNNGGTWAGLLTSSPLFAPALTPITPYIIAHTPLLGAQVKSYYDTLRKMVWRCYTLTDHIPPSVYAESSRRSKYASAANWATTPWVYGDPRAVWGVDVWALPTAGMYDGAYAFRQAMEFTWVSPAPLLASNLDFYVEPLRPIVNDSSRPFLGTELGMSNLLSWLWMSDVPYVAPGLTYEMGKIETLPPIDLDPPYNRWGYSWGQIFVIEKYDVPGGFVFQGS